MSTIVLATGGTGGHLFPAQALAAELTKRGRKIVVMTDARGTQYPTYFPGAAIEIVPSAAFSDRSKLRLMAAPFEISAPAVTKHLKVLEKAGLITRGRHAQWRPCKLAAKPLQDVADWVEQYRRFWEQKFDQLDEYLHELQSKTGTDDTHF